MLLNNINLLPLRIAQYPFQKHNGIGARMNQSTVLHSIAYETMLAFSIMKLLDVSDECSSGFMPDAANTMQVNTFLILANKLVATYILIFLY